MKKLTFSIAVLILTSTLSAQYKKASFFGKEGRTYEIGAQLYALGDGKGSPIGYKFGFGKDQDGKQFFANWEIHYIPSYKYSYTTTDYNDNSVNVSGTSKSTFIYAVNYAYHLLKNDENERKIKPFVTAGFNLVLSTGVKTETITPNSYDLKKQTLDENFNAGLGGGLGVLVNFTQKLGLKIQGGYNYQFQFGGNEYGDDIKSYYLFTSHPYVSAGLRLRIASE